MHDTELARVGDCPVCAGSGAVLVFKALLAHRMIFYCPLCGVAWLEPPQPGRLDSIMSLEEVSPGGVVVPARDEVLAAVDGPLDWVSAEDWLRLMEPGLVPGGAG